MLFEWKIDDVSLQSVKWVKKNKGKGKGWNNVCMENTCHRKNEIYKYKWSSKTSGNKSHTDSPVDGRGFKMMMNVIVLGECSKFIRAATCSR